MNRAIIFALALLTSTPVFADKWNGREFAYNTTLVVSERAYWTNQNTGNSPLAQELAQSAREFADKQGWPKWILISAATSKNGENYVVFNDTYNVTNWVVRNWLSDEQHLQLRDELMKVAKGKFFMVMFGRDAIYYNSYATSAKRVVWEAN